MSDPLLCERCGARMEAERHEGKLIGWACRRCTAARLDEVMRAVASERDEVRGAPPAAGAQPEGGEG